MKTTRLTGRFVITSLLALLIPTVLFAPQAYAETYVGAQFGVTVPSSLSGVELTGVFPGGSTMSDRTLANSFMYGAKLGHFFDKARWLGIETEVFSTTPHIKQQNTIVTVPPSSTVTGGVVSGNVSGDHLRVITWAPLNIVFRYHKTRLQPYVAIGPGIYFARVQSTVAGFEGSQSTTALGLNIQVGLQYYITRNFTVFGEWKYNHAQFDFKETTNQFGFNAAYNAQLLSVGVSYHF